MYGVFVWFSLFVIMIGVVVVCGYVLLGVIWLIFKIEGWL